MIAYLSGTAIRSSLNSLIIVVNGVGYEVYVNQKLALHTEKNQQISLWVHTHQTSEAISLFGFIEENELSFFKLLTSVNGVGPKTALDILENPVEVVENIIVSGDAKTLSQIKGIGAKTAARIVLELKSKITGNEPEVPLESKINEEAVEALTQLGWKKSDIQKILNKLPSEIKNTEEVVKWFLQHK